MRSEKYSSEPLQAYLIPTDDAHQSEYIAECDKRRVFISGFTGSAGVALVTADKALLWTDGRYHLQASKQLDANWILMKQGNDGVPSIEEWMSKELAADAKIGFDPFQTSEELHKKYTEGLESGGQELVATSVNLVDEVWGSERPPRPCNPLLTLSLKYSGEIYLHSYIGRQVHTHTHTHTHIHTHAHTCTHIHTSSTVSIVSCQNLHPCSVASLVTLFCGLQTAGMERPGVWGSVPMGTCTMYPYL